MTLRSSLAHLAPMAREIQPDQAWNAAAEAWRLMRSSLAPLAPAAREIQPEQAWRVAPPFGPDDLFNSDDGESK